MWTPTEWKIRRESRRTVRAAALVLLVALTGCQQKMAHQPKYLPLDVSTFFEDGRSERPLVAGTVPRGFARDDPHLFTGRSAGAYVDTFPFPVTRQDLERGRQRFDIYCAPCHDRTGTGDGMIVRRGFIHPPSLHIERLREAPVGHFFDVITNGFGAMPDYATQVPPRDRWRIIAYVRALQLSQHATLADVPPMEQKQLTRGDQHR